MRSRVLGPVEVWVDVAWRAPSGRLQRTLLGLLLARVGQPVSSDLLVTELWGEGRDEQASARLQVHVHRLRKLLGDPDLLVTVDGGYRLDLDQDDVDWRVFDRLADAVLAAEPGAPSRAEQAREALALWRGEAFAGLDDAVCAGVRDRLVERRLAVAEALYADEVASGGHGAVLADLATLAAEHPLRESVQALLMDALHQTGRQGEALEVFRRTRERLVDELGADPSPQLLDMHDRVLTGTAMSLPGAAPTVPAQLPAAPSRLDGRAGAVDVLDSLLLGRGTPEPEGTRRIVVLCGSAGVGKTALALSWAHRRREDFPEGQLFADLRGFSPGDPARVENLLDGFLRALGADPSGLHGVEERSAQFRSMVVGRRLLVLLDNARSVEQVRPLLPGSETVRVIVTSRQALQGLAVRDGAERVGLGVLDPKEARAMLVSLVGDRLPPEWVPRLAKRCGHLPLALRVAAEQVRIEAAEVIRRLDGGDPALDVLDATDDPTTSAREMFSWSYEALSPGAARLFRALGAMPGPSADLGALVALSGMDETQTRTAAGELTRAHLADLVNGRWSQHDLLAEYAAERARHEEAVEVRVRGLARLLAHYAEQAGQARAWLGRTGGEQSFTTDEEALTWFEHNRTSMVAAIEQAPPGCERSVLDLAENLRDHLRDGAHVDHARRVCEAAVLAARVLDDPAAESMSENAMGTSLVRQGRLEQAAEHHRRAAVLGRSAGDLVREAAAVSNLGVTQQMAGHSGRAMQSYRRSLELCLQAGDLQRARIPTANLAAVLVEFAEYSEDPDQLHEGINLLEDLLESARDNDDRRSMAFGHFNLAEARAQQGRHAEAREHARAGLTLAQTIGDIVNVGEGFELVGTLDLEAGDPIRARQAFTEAREMARRSEDRHLLILTSLGLARAAVDTDPPGSLRLFEEAGALARRYGRAFLEARALRGEAEARHRAGLAGAVRRLERAVALLEECDHPASRVVRVELERARGKESTETEPRVPRARQEPETDGLTLPGEHPSRAVPRGGAGA